MLRHTKIVATLGPASSDLATLERLVQSGVDVVRLNFSHGTAEDHIARARQVRDAAQLGLSNQNGFYHVSHEGTDGWVYGAYLKNSGETTPTGGDDDPPPVTGTFNGRTYSGVTVLWQGNWSFLVKCDSYSRSKGHVVFFCDENPSRSFVDDGAWLAMPRANFSSGSCGKKARVCKGTNCIVATIVEKSETTGRWEGSSAVLKALGVSTGYSGCSSSFGTASGVTITMQ